ncbi:MAG TPA: UvrD-helicase domain-containing protein [Candidatus Thermoplasmatota archaeon]|nr:UvrD-helicase domain-containing protein [Candidatus Thermoplasmatota archaeon]
MKRDPVAPSPRRKANEAAILSGLSEAQIRAVLAPQRVALVIAAAGSGKTKVLVSRILHQIYCEGVRGDSIMAVTFSRDATEEIRARLATSVGKTVSPTGRRGEKETAIDNVTVGTFHSIAYRILREDGAKEFHERFRILGEGGIGEAGGSPGPKSSDVARKVLLDLAEDPTTMKHIIRLLEDYFGAVPQPMKKLPLPVDHRTKKYYRTYRGEWVRSKSERDIANFLYVSNINYEYERPLQVRGTTIHPDFYLPEADVYIEHWGDLDAAYLAGRDAKKQLYQGLRLIETHEEEMTDLARLEERLRDELAAYLHTRPSRPRLPDLEARFSEYGPALHQLLQLLLEVNTKVKVDGKDLKEVVREARYETHEIIRVFYTVCVPFCAEYQKRLAEQSLIDQDDLLILATRLLESHEDVRQKYRQRYRQVLVDEYQDVNAVQVRFLKALVGEENRLFCVGDDWQAIYGWRGSDVQFIVDFHMDFPDHGRYVLPLNYRSHQQIVQISNALIAHNRYKIDKEPVAARRDGTPVAIYRAKEERLDGPKFVTTRVRELSDSGCQVENILLIYRKRSDASPYLDALKAEGLRVRARTMHACKGLEADYVFVVGLRGGSRGFPTVREDPRILQIVRKTDLTRRLEEERRLFYVAMTRAREGLFLVTSAENPSPFIGELPPLPEPGGEELPLFPGTSPDPLDEILPRAAPAEVRERYRALLIWRTEQAHREAIPEMAVASDRLLYALAEAAPATLEDLRRIDGVGEIRAMKYGQAWIEMLNPPSHLASPTSPPPPATAPSSPSAEHTDPLPLWRRAWEFLTLVLTQPRLERGAKPPRLDKSPIHPSRGIPAQPPPRPELERSELLDRLKAWRKQEAVRQRVPLYLVLPERTLHEIAVRRPKDLKALLAVHGIGSRRAVSYGDAILEIVNGR